VLGFLVRRLGWAITLTFAVTLVTFVVFFVLPTHYNNARRNERGTDLQTQFDARGSVPVQYLHFLGHVVLHFDLGTSRASDEPVTDVLRRTLPVTASLVLGGVILWLLLAFPIGVLSALRPRSLLDKGLMLLVVTGAAAHPVWVSLLFSYFFGVRLHVFPISGYCDFVYHADSSYGCGGPRFWAFHMTLPWITYALVFAALYARMIRGSLMETMEEDYVRTARAKGASTFRVVRRHALRNAMLPVITMLGMDVGVAFAGALFIEDVFDLPGMGRLFVNSIGAGDVPVIMGIALVVSFAVVIANLLVDMLYSIADPRIRTSTMGGMIRVSRAESRALSSGQAQTPATESAAS
jgi:peptide/nickel transport system permease protein